MYIENKNTKINTAAITNIIPLTKILSAKDVFLVSISLLNILYSLKSNLPKTADAKENKDKIILRAITIVFIFDFHQQKVLSLN